MNQQSPQEQGNELDFRRLYESAPCGWFTMRLDGVVVRANAMMCALTGRPDVCGENFSDLLSAGGRIYLQTHGVPMLRISGGLREIALDLVRPDGSRLPVLLNALLADDELVHATLFDATDRRSYERELLEARRRAERVAAELQQAQAGLLHAAQHDPLTGLANRPRTTEQLERALARGGPVWVLFIDLDRFKAVNDSLGHEAGDLLLQETARRLQHVCEGALLGRWGGDEFLLVLPPTADQDMAERVARAALEVVSRPVDVGRMEVGIGASIGIGGSDASTQDPDALVRRADVAMYQAKARGRNRFQVADALGPAPVQELVSLVNDLRSGIGRGELRLHYQPRVDLRSGSVKGVEALVRWQHPTRGLIAPAAFIDVAERSGLIRSVDAWVLEEAVRQAATWNRDRTLDVAINLSAPEIADPDLPERVREVTDRHALPPARLTLEVTETALLLDTDTALANAEQLRDSGVRLALDDFGTGYSGFTYLKRLPVDEVKIDRSFVAGMLEHASDRAIVRGTIAMGHELGLEVVAEGIEVAAQDAALIELGCDTAQGYLYLRPVPAVDLAPFLPSQQPSQEGLAGRLRRA